MTAQVIRQRYTALHPNTVCEAWACCWASPDMRPALIRQREEHKGSFRRENPRCMLDFTEDAAVMCEQSEVVYS